MSYAKRDAYVIKQAVNEVFELLRKNYIMNFSIHKLVLVAILKLVAVLVDEVQDWHTPARTFEKLQKIIIEPI